MKVCTSDLDTTVVDRWLTSGETIRLCGLDLRPLPHPLMPGRARSVTKGQATVWFLGQHPHGTRWLLKKFHNAQRPTDAYLNAVHQCLPGSISFFTCMQRRLVEARHLDAYASGFRESTLAAWLAGTVLMPKVPGEPWAILADKLRVGTLRYTVVQRLTLAGRLARIIQTLEASSCAHRDLSLGNVFVDDELRPYLIDWDSLYHPSLPFQSNTTVGTLGYIVPFLRQADGTWSAQLSWNATADRFSVAILIAEILLTDPAVPESQEDGTLFAQQQFHDPSHPFIQEQLQRLARVSPRCAGLLQQTLASSSFATCADPEAWCSALKHAERSHARNSGSPASPRRARWESCAHCGKPVSIHEDRFAELNRAGKKVLCTACLGAALNEWNQSRLSRDQQAPTCNCEHCRQTFRIPRPRLEDLRARGKPILCRDCLGKQLQTWQHERAQRLEAASCATCLAPIRIPRETAAALRARGKPVCCATCRQSRPMTGTMSPPRSQVHKGGLAGFLRSIFGS